MFFILVYLTLSSGHFLFKYWPLLGFLRVLFSLPVHCAAVLTLRYFHIYAWSHFCTLSGSTCTFFHMYTLRFTYILVLIQPFFSQRVCRHIQYGINRKVFSVWTTLSSSHCFLRRVGLYRDLQVIFLDLPCWFTGCCL